MAVMPAARLTKPKIRSQESVRARMRIEVRKLLARYGYPPDLQKAAVDLVIRQAEAFANAWN
ncbi:type I restriction enzyme endonuclease domain-containing protein [Bradyrhizobium tunisiense]|uniref:type I restriction enzyme endonuclease domain-containing protein n=1 Tax=Bradyrhizobium tunisiense TaxID=3278709 RepID=UPI0035D69C89